MDHAMGYSGKFILLLLLSGVFRDRGVSSSSTYRSPHIWTWARVQLTLVPQLQVYKLANLLNLLNLAILVNLVNLMKPGAREL